MGAKPAQRCPLPFSLSIGITGVPHHTIVIASNVDHDSQLTLDFAVRGNVSAYPDAFEINEAMACIRQASFDRAIVQ